MHFHYVTATCWHKLDMSHKLKNNNIFITLKISHYRLQMSTFGALSFKFQVIFSVP